MAKLIPLTQGKFATVDDTDFELLNQWKWYYDKRTGGAQRQIRVNGKCIVIRMNKFLLNVTDPKMCVIFLNGNHLDYRRENLREATKSLAMSRRRKATGTKSKYKGILETDFGLWKAIIKAGGKTVYLGTRETEEEAARLYDVAAKEFYGELAVLNFPGE